MLQGEYQTSCTSVIYRNLPRRKTWRENLRDLASCEKCGWPTIRRDSRSSSSLAQKMRLMWSRRLTGRCFVGQKFEWSLQRQTALRTWSDRSGATRQRRLCLRPRFCLRTAFHPCCRCRLEPGRWYRLQFRTVRYPHFCRCVTRRQHAGAETTCASRRLNLWVFGGTVQRPLCHFFCLLPSSTEDDHLLVVTGKMRSSFVSIVTLTVDFYKCSLDLWLLLSVEVVSKS